MSYNPNDIECTSTAWRPSTNWQPDDNWYMQWLQVLNPINKQLDQIEQLQELVAKLEKKVAELEQTIALNKCDTRSITINGAVDVRANPISVNDFLDKFIDWIESNHWYFGGSIGKDEENE